MVIQSNISSANASRQYGITGKKISKSMEKLSSGYRINRAADDAAGLSISEKMRKQIRGLSRGVTNTQDGVSLCQVADGALNEMTSMVQRINELSIQAANGTNSTSDRQSIQDEITQIIEEVDRISQTTTFNDQNIFDGGQAAHLPLPGKLRHRPRHQVL
jgi:flagellin